MSIKQENTARIAKNTFFMFIRMALVAVVGFFTSRVVLNTLGIEDFGIYNVVGSVIVFLSFFKQALNNATYRYLTYELGCGSCERLRKTFAMSLNVHVILAVVLFVILEIGGVWLLNTKLQIPAERLPAANWTFQLSLVCFAIEIVKTPYNSSVISHERMDFYAYTSIVEVLLKLSVVYLLVVAPFDKLVLYSFLLLLVAVVMLVWYIVYCVRKFPETAYKFHWDSSMCKNFTSYSGWSLLVNASDVTVAQSINIFFNIFSGVAVNAAMGVANQVNQQLNNFLATFTTSFNPQIIKSYAQKDYVYFMKLIFSTSKISYYLLFAVSFPIMLNIDFILKLWLGVPPEMTAVFLRYIIIYSLIDAFSAPLWNAVHATGYIRTHQILMSAIKLINIPLAYMMLKTGQPVYYAVALMAGLNGVCSIVRAVYMRSLISLNLAEYMIQVIGRIGIVTVISMPLPMYFRFNGSESWFTLFTSTTSFILPYLGVVYIMGLSKSERTIVKSLVMKRIGKKDY